MSSLQEREDFSIDRQRLLVDQPPRTANFTRDGFKITRAPPLLLEALQSFFEITKYNYSREVGFPGLLGCAWRSQVPECHAHSRVLLIRS